MKMNKTSVRIITGVMAVCLLALVAIQVFWIQAALELRDAKFRENVNLALSDLESSLSPEPKVTVELIEASEEPVIITDSSSDVRVISVISGDPDEIRQSIAESKMVFKDGQTGNEQHSYSYAWSSDETDSIPVEVILDRTLKSHGIAFDYEAEFLSGSKAEVISENVYRKDGKDNNIVFRKVIQTRDSPEPETLTLTFKNQGSRLIENMNLILPTSGVLILVISLCFALTLILLLRQKKLSDMKSDFISNMTHELKTPISTISLASEALLDPEIDKSEERVSHFAGLIQSENERLKNQVEKVLEWARIERGELRLNKSTFGLKQLLTQETDRIRPRIKALKGQLDIGLPEEEIPISADRIHLSNVIANLLDNAVKYSGDSPPQIQLYLHKASNKPVRVSISDQGTGMNREQIRRIFEKFYRVPTGNRHDVKGFGLGLSYAKAIMEAHDGTISVESEPGKGSTFTLTFTDHA